MLIRVPLVIVIISVPVPLSQFKSKNLIYILLVTSEKNRNVLKASISTSTGPIGPDINTERPRGNILALKKLIQQQEKKRKNEYGATRK